MKSKLRVQNLSTWVRLGCTEAERAHAQEVRWSLDLEFAFLPQATKSDDLAETVCYAKICDALRDFSEGREFATVEKLASDGFSRVKDIVGSRAALKLHLHKVRPPVPHLEGGVVFTLEE